MTFSGRAPPSMGRPPWVMRAISATQSSAAEVSTPLLLYPLPLIDDLLMPEVAGAGHVHADAQTLGTGLYLGVRLGAARLHQVFHAEAPERFDQILEGNEGIAETDKVRGLHAG